MEVLKFIVSNFDNIIAILVILLAIICALVALRYPTLKNTLIQLVTEAEIKFPIKESGELKKSFVLNEIYKILPGWMKTFVTYSMLSWMIEKALVVAKELWGNNEEIGKYIDEMKKIIMYENQEKMSLIESQYNTTTE